MYVPYVLFVMHESIETKNDERLQTTAVTYTLRSWNVAFLLLHPDSRDTEEFDDFPVQNLIALYFFSDGLSFSFPFTFGDLIFSLNLS